MMINGRLQVSMSDVNAVFGRKFSKWAYRWNRASQ